MEHNFISRLIKYTCFLALGTFFIIGFYQSFFDGIGILIGAGWGLINLYFLKKSLEEWLKVKSRNHLKFLILIQIKFPILYLMVYGLYRLKFFSMLTFLGGFSLIFLSIFLLSLIHVFKSYRFETESKI